MIASTIETSSRVDDRDAAPQTAGIQTDDWVLPEIESDQWSGEETTSYKLDDRMAIRPGTTMPGEYPKVPEPVRKDSLVIRFPRDHVTLLQQWECIISRVGHDCVECEMHDLTDESTPVEIAEVYLTEFNHFDRPLLQEGAVFYWSIGLETKKTGQVRRYSELRVRRMPKISSSKMREINERAKQLSEILANNP